MSGKHFLFTVEKELLMNHVHDVTTTGSALANLASTGLGGGIMATNDLGSMYPLGGLVPPTAGLPAAGMLGDSMMVDMLEIPGKGRCYVYFARYILLPFGIIIFDCFLINVS